MPIATAPISRRRSAPTRYSGQDGQYRAIKLSIIRQRAQEGGVHILQQTGAGVLPVEIRFKDGRPQRVTMTQKEAQFKPLKVKSAALAKALGLSPKETPYVSNTTVFVLPSLGTDPVTRFNQQVEADLKRNEPDQDGRRVNRVLPRSRRRAPIPRRSRRSAWVPSEV